MRKAANSSIDQVFAQDILAQRADLGFLDGVALKWLSDLRSDGSDRLNNLKFPSPKDEEWRNTNFSELLDVSWQRSLQDLNSLNIPASIVSNYILPEAAESLITFVDGQFAPQLSALEGLPQGVFIGSLVNLTKIGINLQSCITHLNKYIDSQDFFATLNTACLQDVAIVYIPKDVVIEQTIQLLFTANQPGISQPRCLIVAEAGSSIKVLETYIGRGSQFYFTNAVTEVFVGENAQVNHTKLQWESELAVHVSNSAIAQARHSRYTQNSISLGAKKSRHNLLIQQLGEQTETTLNGLTLISGEQLADTHSAIAHNYPHGTSNQLHKCIADQRSHCIFNGKILVAQAAQLTNSKQSSRNLLLSSKARIDTKPQLEILADNVKCAHGATVSQIEAEEMFYLQSRGIDLSSAAKLLTYAFASEVIDRIPIKSLRETLNQFVLDRTQNDFAFPS